MLDVLNAALPHGSWLTRDCPASGPAAVGCDAGSGRGWQDLPLVVRCLTIKKAVTIRLEPELERLLDRLCRETGRTRSDLVRHALRRQLQLLRFEQLRRRVLPFAEARGYLTDEDVAKAVS